MRCKEVRRELSALLDGELSPSAGKAIRRHVDSCGSCSLFYDELTRVKQLVDRERVDEAIETAEPLKGRRWEGSEKCPVCGGDLVIRYSKTGAFLGCVDYPDCKGLMPIPGEGSDDGETDGEPVDCPNCGKPMLLKSSRYGKFYACSGYPECRYVAPLEGREDDVPQVEGEVCEKCGKPMQAKRGKYGYFLGCTGYPECKNIRPLKKPLDTKVTCPECGAGTLIERTGKKKRVKGKVFYGCSKYPKCTYIINDRPYPKPCPKCASPFMVIKGTKDEKKELKCPAEGCEYSEKIDKKILEEIKGESG